MKKSMWSTLSMMTLAGSVLMASCSPFAEEPIQIQQVTDSEALVAPESFTNQNARKTVEKNYFERFTNQLTQVDENGIYTPNIPAYFPGTGAGNASHMGKAVTFLNQYASFGVNGLGSVGAPVTQFYSSELEKLGIVVDNPDVSSVTTDGKGNSVWFKNKQNTITTSSEERSDFEAEVEIVGGTGKFENASGTAIVTGYFNPKNGSGSSTMQGTIVF
ncbi:hypothetical protein SYJ56_16600 [Algoriphagus sp. D3-2-R+10]|uniref:hypothetical protein n=1 Tax=Algoriphagus aurantiacus TaxID=3103948 RepID=UPI002B3D3F21|nr:hypothetical protein [Algoriphagus sp. D3-2-R+10]MEB2776938.1 hypothetical protein [Algoriphagus sp. D3-2-R+10]